MPHVVVKMLAGRTEEQKERLAREITKALKDALGSEDKSVSIAIEDVLREEWTEKVYKPEILPNMERLYKKPGYEPF